MTDKGRLLLGTWSNNYFCCFLSWEIKTQINEKKARPSETHVAGKLQRCGLYLCIAPKPSRTHYTFSAFPTYCRYKYRGLWPSPGLLYIRLPYISGSHHSGSFPTLSNKSAGVLAGPPCVPVLANSRQQLQTLGLGLFHSTSNKTSSWLMALVVWSLEKKK